MPSRDTQTTGSFLRPSVVVFCSIILLCFYILGLKSTSTHLDWDDAVFLARNSIKEFNQQYIQPLGMKYRYELLNENSTVQDVELDYPLNNVVNSFFPIDAVIKFNTTERHHNVTTHELIARYASFSPILNYKLESKYKILPYNACNLDELKFLDPEEYGKKILIVLRGDCTFVDKVTTLMDSHLKPKSIIIANDEPYRGLITMFSNTFNQDGSLQVPIMFITNEDYNNLQDYEPQNLSLEITTAYIGSWVSIILSMVLSPPLLILLFYAIVICGQKIRRRQVNKQNAKMVRSLPIYIYNIDHLISAKHFQHYLKVTGQSNMVPKDSENAMLLDSPKASPNGSTTSINRIIVGGIDLRASKTHLHSITAPDDFYPSYKCSICLEKYVPLKSKVLVLDCKHFFHEKCLSNWLINFKRSCPLCNYMLHNSRHTTAFLLAGQEDNADYGSTADLEAGLSSPFFGLSPSQVESIDSDRYSLALSTGGVHDEPDTEVHGQPEHTNYHREELDFAINRDNAPQSMSSDASDTTFYTANSQPTEGSSSRGDTPSTDAASASSAAPRRPYLVSKPLQILSRFSGSRMSDGGELSTSIDSGSDNNHDDKSTIESSNTSIIELDHADESTIDLSRLH
ncbi:hypothetical protein Cantr_09280 [Candida viswanathii]|uniref:RING-type domain-containing protein n=1 Tax=Candida viswanathii TaxID=5486 RepID=A0A367Y9Z9_9ASCO|nr:hypothetical protein Cantr_09280 [Candida viswanathii]